MRWFALKERLELQLIPDNFSGNPRLDTPISLLLLIFLTLLLTGGPGEEIGFTSLGTWGKFLRCENNIKGNNFRS